VLMNINYKDDDELYHVAYAESSMNNLWNSVIFSDESTPSSSNNGLVLDSDHGESATTVNMCRPLHTRTRTRRFIISSFIQHVLCFVS
jgi:hypothetical protein